jgi:membrane protease YdiL (CAAX protease family)
MRPTALFFGYLVCCLAAAAALAVPLVETGWLDYPPERIMGRLAQIFVLVGFWPLLKAMGLADRASLGYAVPRRELLRAVILGWVLGLLILLALAGTLYGLQVRVPDPDPGPWSFLVAKSAQALLGGLVIGLLEETFFRGALYAALRRRGGVASAAFWSALLYALLHVMKPGALPPGVAFDWSGAWSMVVGVFADAVQWRHLDSLLALFAVGVFLALVRERTGHIGWCIGLHAGWVLVIQTTRRLTDADPDSSLAFLAGDYDGTIGWLSTAWIGLLTLVLWIWSTRRTGIRLQRRASPSERE